MLVAHDLSKAYGPNPILEKVSFAINAGDRVGLIGPNGSGKTTLLRLLSGHDKADSGYVSFQPPGLRLGYLPQGLEHDAGLTLEELIHATIGTPELLQEELERLAQALAQEHQREELRLAYDRVLSRLGQHEIGRVQSVMASLALDRIDSESRIGALSGGQKTRLSLALVLLSDPQILLLDEPTNHLDIQMLQWLEQWLAEFAGGALIVSHDRAFLDRTVSQILDLDPETKTIRQYRGNYSDYLDQFLWEREKQLAAYKDQVYEKRRIRQDIQRTKEQARWVERTTTPRQPGVRRYAKKVAKKAKTREKRLQRYLASEDRVEKPGRSWQMKMDLENAPRLGRDVLMLDNLSVGYPGHSPLIRELSQQVSAGQRIVLTGPNGSGKSTLVRTIVGLVPPLAGNVRLGASVRLGYMAQEQEMLDPNLTSLQIIAENVGMNETDIRSFLHHFLFSGDDPLRPVGQLSFGERSRLSLALLVAQGCNLLVLDEPINHLDIPSRELFEQALGQFDGTVLAVVHDRYFIARFATDLWMLEDLQLRVETLRR